jgi:LytS/YehU family sensor histidine kinase
MLNNLAELLRYSLSSDRAETVPLADELRIVDEYLNLERVRLDERLNVERRIAPEAVRAQVPPMLVQMLVENAIKHGISELPAGGVVRIDAPLRRTAG